jgi:hypothetical protein
MLKESTIYVPLTRSSAACRRALQCYMCPHTALYVSSYCYVFVLILLYMCALIPPYYSIIRLFFSFFAQVISRFFFISVKSLYVLAALNKTSQNHDLTGHVERD